MTRAKACATDLTAACARLLGPVLAAVIPHGSLALGRGSQAQFAPLVRRAVPDRLWDSMMLRVAPFPTTE